MNEKRPMPAESASCGNGRVGRAIARTAAGLGAGCCARAAAPATASAGNASVVERLVAIAAEQRDVAGDDVAQRVAREAADREGAPGIRLAERRAAARARGERRRPEPQVPARVERQLGERDVAAEDARLAQHREAQ